MLQPVATANCFLWFAPRATQIAARGRWSFPHIETVSETPTLRPDGTIIQEPGYDAATATLYLPNAEFPPVPDDAPDFVREFLGTPRQRSAWQRGTPRRSQWPVRELRRSRLRGNETSWRLSPQSGGSKFQPPCWTGTGLPGSSQVCGLMSPGTISRQTRCARRAH